MHLNFCVFFFNLLTYFCSVFLPRILVLSVILLSSHFLLFVACSPALCVHVLHVLNVLSIFWMYVICSLFVAITVTTSLLPFSQLLIVITLSFSHHSIAGLFLLLFFPPSCSILSSSHFILPLSSSWVLHPFCYLSYFISTLSRTILSVFLPSYLISSNINFIFIF